MVQSLYISIGLFIKTEQNTPMNINVKSDFKVDWVQIYLHSVHTHPNVLPNEIYRGHGHWLSLSILLLLPLMTICQVAERWCHWFFSCSSLGLVNPLLVTHLPTVWDLLLPLA